MSPYRWLTLISRVCLVAALVLTAAFTASAEWKEKVLYSFQGGADGWMPEGGVVLDKAGNLYGANSRSGSGGCPSSGCGTVFEISPPIQRGGAWTETTLYTFQGISGGKTDGATPTGGVIIDEQGNLYGTTAYGGNGPCELFGSTTGCGIVYELSPPAQQGGQWAYTILYNFQGGNDGQFPWGDLVFDKKGTLYGATQFGGGKGTTCDPFYQYCGTVFELSPPKQKGGAWKEKVLHSFAGGTDGANPNGGLVFDSRGVVYGTSVSGGNQGCQDSYGIGCGTAFRLAPPTQKGGAWKEKILYRFQGRPNDGLAPNGGLVLDANGALYGTTPGGGSGNAYGTVFGLTPPNKRKGAWVETLLHVFETCGRYDPCIPTSGVIFDSVGDLYGVAGGVFRLKPPVRKGANWDFTNLYEFTGSPDGSDPLGFVLGDGHTIFGTTAYGGTGQACQGGCGAAFQVWP